MPTLAGQLYLPLGDPHHNRGLFADHFLNTPERLHALPEWGTADGVHDAFAAIHLLYQKAVQFSARTNEAQTERDFVRPVLDVLWRDQAAGDAYEVQVPIPNLDASRQPDYAFFRTSNDRRAAEPHKGSLPYWNEAPALGDAKRWSASLDKERGADENPSAQICNYLYRSRVRWGILTNGRVWRLYEREKSSAGGIYYEVDLIALLQRGDLEAFKYFYLFFRRQAFLPQDGGTFLDKVLQGSTEYTTGVTDRLKENVYDALRLLMDGFSEQDTNGLDSANPEHLRMVHEQSLIVLYRLLFLLYAEDRGLLPLDDPAYRDSSLKRLHQEINNNLRAERTYLRGGRRLWQELTGLFELIDNGLEDSGHSVIPAYNGGLFNPERFPHIAHTPQPGVTRWLIGDDRLAHVIDMLAYQRAQWHVPGSDDVDYAALDVSHLGSIYEGLLELQPHIAPEPLVETMEDGKPVFKPQRDVPNPRNLRGQPPRTIPAGEVYLITNRGERKATGSYYTPKYIVDYIVEHTVGPLADEAARQVAAVRPEVDKAIGQLQRRQRGFASVPVEVDKAQRGIEAQQRRLIEPYLSLKILDPAMGSGHFLVGAADWLSLAMATDPNLLLPAEAEGEDPQTYYKRLVVERCLYGVDLNPLAVELAKLSLWLHTVSKDQALSFLDHHLRCGNSLIGARLEEDLVKEPPRFNERGRRINAGTQQLVLGFTETLTASHLHYFLDTFRQIMETPSGDAAQEREKDHLYRVMDQARDRFRQVANLWLVPYFGVPVSPEHFGRAVQLLRGTDAEWLALTAEAWFQRAQTEAQVRRFFHWELEFPEAFFTPTGRKPQEELGFDAVIGNPPYIDSEEMVKSMQAERIYYAQAFDTAKGNWDIFVVFLEVSIRLLKDGYCSSMIIPNKLLGAEYCIEIQRLINKNSLKYVRDYSSVNVFPDAGVYPIVLGVSRERSREADNIDVSVMRDISGNEPVIVWQRSFPHLLLEILPVGAWQPIFSENVAILGTCIARSQRCDSLAEISDAATVAEAYELAKVIKSHADIALVDGPFFRFINTGTIDRYCELWAIHRVQYIGAQIVAPVVLQHELYDISRTRVAQAMTKKIILGGLTKVIEAYYDDDANILAGKSTVVIRNAQVDLGFLTALLNSSLLTFLYKELFGALALQGGYLQVNPSQVRKLPIRRISFTTPSAERTSFHEQAGALYDGFIDSENTVAVQTFVRQRLEHDPEQVDVVHDLLANLAAEMIRMNQQKQAEVKGFLTWLERHIGAQVEDLGNKTRVRDYHEHDFNALLAVLTQNRRKLGPGVNPADRGFQEHLEREFAASVAKLAPLKAHIAATDRLIDLIVYRLYGLTDEEVAIVEHIG